MDKGNFPNDDTLAHQSIDLSWVAGAGTTEDGTIFTINHDSRPSPRSTGGNRRNGERSNINFNCLQLTPATPPVINQQTVTRRAVEKTNF